MLPDQFQPTDMPPPPVPPQVTTVDAEVAREHPEKVGKPDGVPHDVVGVLAFSIVLVAITMGILYMFIGLTATVIIALVLTPFVIVPLARRAAGERTEEAYGLPPGSVTKSTHPTAHPPVDLHREDDQRT